MGGCADRSRIQRSGFGNRIKGVTMKKLVIGLTQLEKATNDGVVRHRILALVLLSNRMPSGGAAEGF